MSHSFHLLLGVVLSSLISSLDTGDLMMLISALLTAFIQILHMSRKATWVRLGLLYGFVVEALKLGS
jgi:hypothetical protein